MLTEDEKIQLTVDMFPLAIQALYNAKRVLKSDLSGSWWKLPENTLQATLMDCSIVLEILYRLGLFPCDCDKEMAHINIHEKKNIFDKFNWLKSQTSQKINELVEKEVEVRMDKYKKEFMDELGEKEIEKRTEAFKHELFCRMRFLLERIKESADFLNRVSALKIHFKNLCNKLELLHEEYPFNREIRHIHDTTLPRIIELYKSVRGYQLNFNQIPEFQELYKEEEKDIPSDTEQQT